MSLVWRQGYACEQRGDVMGERAKAGLLVLLFCAALVQGCLASTDEVTGGPGDGAIDESDLVRPDPDVYTCFMPVSYTHLRAHET